MGIVFRQSVKSSIVIFLGAFLGAVSNLIYPYVLSQTQLGFFTNIIYWSALLQLFMLLGAGSVLTAFIQKYPEGDERRKVMITGSILLTVATTLLFSVIYLFSKEYIVSRYQPADQALVREYFYWTPLLILLMSFGTLFEMYLMSQTKTAIAAFSKEVLLRVLNLILLGLLAVKFIDFKEFIIASIFAYVIPAVMLMYASAQTKSFGFSVNWKVFSRREYSEIVKFSWYHLLLGVTFNVMGYLDTLMLATLGDKGMETVAPYRIAVFVISVGIIPYRAMSTSSVSSLNQAYIDNDMAHLANLSRRAGTNILAVTTGVFLLITSNLNNVVAILPEGYELVKPVILILCVGRLMDVFTGVNTEIISFSKYYKFNFRISVLLVILLYTFNRLLIPAWGIYGAAWSATITLLLFNVAKTAFLWWKMKLHPLNSDNISIVFAALIIGFIGYTLPFISVNSLPKLANIALDLLIRSAMVGGLYLSFLLWRKPSKDLSNYIATIKKDKRLF